MVGVCSGEVDPGYTLTKAAQDYQPFDTSSAGKGLHYKAMGRLRAPHVERWTEGLRSAMDRQIEDVLGQVRRSGPSGLLLPEEPLQEAYEAMYREVGSEFAERTFDASKAVGHAVKQEDWEELVLRFLRTRAARRIVMVNETTKEMVRQVSADAVTEGWGVSKVMDALEERWGGLRDTRAERISRTEVLSASNWGSQEGARSTGFDMQREWIATMDSRTRRHEPHNTPYGHDPGNRYDHLDMHGQKSPMDEPWQVPDRFGGSAPHQFPGDPNAPAESTIQCRCAEAFEVL